MLCHYKYLHQIQNCNYYFFFSLALTPLTMTLTEMRKQTQLAEYFFVLILEIFKNTQNILYFSICGNEKKIEFSQFDQRI